VLELENLIPINSMLSERKIFNKEFDEEKLLININDKNKIENNFNNPLKINTDEISLLSECKKSKKRRISSKKSSKKCTIRNKRSSNKNIQFEENFLNKLDKNIEENSLNRNRQILVVDDVETIVNSISKLLNLIMKENNIKYDIIKCHDGIDILNEVINDQKREQSLIDLIITDENMDFVNGTDAISLLRKIEDKKKLGYRI
jgi:CheY-like chemotaxis protein